MLASVTGQLTSLIDAVATVLFRAMGLIVRVAPLGVLGAVGFLQRGDGLVGLARR